MKIDIPESPRFIIETLYANGYEAFVVGGCVRDSLLHKKPNDWDLCTNALPEETIKIFRNDFNIIETGLKHGTITLVNKNKECFEVTTYRIDGEYEDNRRPKKVEYTSLLVEDLSRRDFTINAMAYNHYRGLIDYFSGEKDLNEKVIRCVGDSKQRFNEDALRILRAYRFMAKLEGFTLDKDVLESSKELAYLLKNISVERIREEFNKIILHNSDILEVLLEQGILEYIMPELIDLKGCIQNNPYHIMDVFGHTLKALNNTREDLILKLTVLLHDIGKPKVRTTDGEGIDHFYLHGQKSVDISKDILKRLKYDNKTIDKVLILVENHDCEVSSNRSIKRMLNKIGEENFRCLLEVKRADIYGQNPVYKKEGLKNLDEVEGKFENILLENQCFSLKDLSIKGADLIEIGMKPGKEIGLTLNHILEKVIDDETLNNRDILLNIAKEFIQSKS